MQGNQHIGTFLKGVLSYHSTIPTEKDVERSKKRPKVRATLRVYHQTTPNTYYVTLSKNEGFSKCKTIISSLP